MSSHSPPGGPPKAPSAPTPALLFERALAELFPPPWVSSSENRDWEVYIPPDRINDIKASPNTTRDDIVSRFRELADAETQKWVILDPAEFNAHMDPAKALDFLLEWIAFYEVRRKQALIDLEHEYPDLLSATNTPRVKGMIDALSTHDLLEMSRWAFRRAQLIKAFPDYHDFDAKIDLRNAFHHIALAWTNDEKDILTSIHDNYAAYGNAPHEEDIFTLLKSVSYNGGDIFKKLWATIDLWLAIRAGLIQDTTLHKYLETLLWDAYKNLTPAQQQEYRHSHITTPDGRTISSAGKLFERTQKLRVPLDFLTDLTDPYGTIRANDACLRDVSQNIVNSLVDRAEKTAVPHSSDSILDKIRVAEAHKWNRRYDLHETFLKYAKEHITLPDWTEKIPNLDQFVPGSYLEVTQNGKKYYLELLKDVSFQQPNHPRIDVPVYDGTTIGIRAKTYSVEQGALKYQKRSEISYDDLYKSLQETQNGIKILNPLQFEWLLTKDPENPNEAWKILDLRWDEVTMARLKHYISEIDQDGEKHLFRRWTYFEAAAIDPETGKRKEKEIWRVHKLDAKNGKIAIMNSMGRVQSDIDIADFYQTISEPETWFKRVDYIRDDKDFLTSLKQSFGIHEEAKIKDGIILQPLLDTETNTKKDITMRYFGNEKRGFRVHKIENGMVYYQEYGGETNDKKGLKKKKDKFYPYSSLQIATQGQFLHMLEENKLKAIITADDPGKVSGSNAYNSRMTWSILSRLVQMPNFATIVKGGGMFFKNIKQVFEQWAGADAARFALTLAQYLPSFLSSVQTSQYAAVISLSQKYIEDKKKEIGGQLGGPESRQMCIGIAQCKDSRPEHVVAAILFLLESYGQFYSEDLSKFQRVINKNSLNDPKHGPGWLMFFDAMVITNRLWDVYEWRNKMYEKAKNEHEGSTAEPIEEHMIHMLLKTLDKSGSNEYPFASCVGKAMGWASKYGKIWKNEGFESAIAKWKSDTNTLYKEPRMKKGLWYLKTRELYRAAGSMEKILEKTQSPKDQILPFIWCVSGFSQFVSEESLQQIKGYAEGKITFHAYTFMRTAETNELYKNTVLSFMRDMVKYWGQKGDTKKKMFFQNGIHNFDVALKKILKWEEQGIDLMQKFWDKYWDQWLHDALQGQNGWLMKKMREGDPTAMKYANTWQNFSGVTFIDAHGWGGNDHGWRSEWGYTGSMIPWFSRDMKYRSFEPALERIRFRRAWEIGSTLQIESELDNRVIWEPIKRIITKDFHNLDFFLWDEEAQKAQFLFTRKELIEFFSKYMNARTAASYVGKDEEDNKKNRKNAIKNSAILSTLKHEFGISPEAVFEEKVEHEKEDEDYHDWKYNLWKNVAGVRKQVETDVINAIRNP